MGVRDNLIKKLKTEVEKGLITEVQISYILVLVRKILETDENLKNKYFVLKFYCDWVLHIKIDRITSDIKNKIIEPFLKDKVSGNFFDLNDFGQDFIKFLEEFEIDKNHIYKDKKSTLLFIHIVRNLLINSPLIIKSLGGKKIIITDSRLTKNNISLIGYKIEEI